MAGFRGQTISDKMENAVMPVQLSDNGTDVITLFIFYLAHHEPGSSTTS